MAAVAIAASVVTVMPAEAAPGYTVRLSQARFEPNGPSPATSVADTTSPAMSLDGVWVAFSSDASNLVSGDRNRVADVFVRNVFTKQIRRVSVTTSGREANGPSHSPAISAYGDRIAFVSAASNLVRGDTNGQPDIFLRDLRTGTTTLVSVSSTGRRADGESRTPFVSLFGRYVTFESAASNLASGDRNGVADAFVRDVTKRRTWRIAPPAYTDEPSLTKDVTIPPTKPPTDAGPVPAVYPPRPFGNLWTMHPTISYDGRHVAFVRGATRDTPSTVWPTHASSLDTFVYDRVARRYTRVAAPRYGNMLKNMTGSPMIAADGRSVVFESWSVADEFDALVRNPLDVKQIFRYDLPAKVLARISINSWGLPANADSYAPKVTSHGEAVVFASDATNLVAGDTNGQPDVFVYDSRSRTTSRISMGGAMTQANGTSLRPTTDFGAYRVAYSSSATNLIRGDDNAAPDVFLRERLITAPNRKPTLRPIGAARAIDMLREVRLQLKASDPDRDPVRYGIIAGRPRMPRNATVDPITGVFRWTPDPDEPGPWELFFWVDDPQGASDIEVAKFFVRDLTSSCAGVC